MHPNTGTSSDRAQGSLLERLEEMERELGALRRQLEHSQRLATLGTIAGSIAHEFNNILTPVMSYAQMALATMDDQALVGKALRKAMDGSERASKIASAMLGFAKEIDPGPAWVADDIDHALACLARDPARDGVRLEIDVAKDLVAAISSVSLQQIIMNLALNAIEAMKPGGGVLTIRASVAEGEDRSTWNTSLPQDPPPPHSGEIVLEVTDSGHGVGPEVAARVFEPFVTASQGGDGRQGHGLGLPICKRLVEAAGGSIAFRSAPGRGTTVRLMLPRGEATGGHAGPASAEQAA